MLAMTFAEVEERARSFLRKLRKRAGAGSELRCELAEGVSAIGGGAAPTTHPRTTLLSLTHTKLSADALEEALRRLNPPIISRISEDKVVLDLRTVAPDEEAALLEALTALPA
jgi:L-seryl-tRNA(Ser) seleniumtransferase